MHANYFQILFLTNVSVHFSRIEVHLIAMERSSEKKKKKGVQAPGGFETAPLGCPKKTENVMRMRMRN